MRISEYVSTGHPDKVADYISEYILDRLIERDPNTRYALEVQIKDNHVTLGGEITTTVNEFKWNEWVKAALLKIGYTQEYCDKWGYDNTIDPSQLTLDVHVSSQSPDIAQGVNNDGWGDQGIFWGMATNETTSMLPLDYVLAMNLCQHLYHMAATGDGDWGLDIKTQVVMTEDFVVKKVIVAAPIRTPEAQEALIKEIRMFTVPEEQEYELIVNGTGTYIKHASIGDCGTTGRKLAVDFYGGNCRIGGGCPWTKDPTKADLTLNLYARILAKEALRKHNLDTAYVSIGCCIGKSDIDVTIYDNKNNIVDSYTYAVKPKEIIKKYNLDKPIYADLCMNGLWS